MHESDASRIVTAILPFQARSLEDFAMVKDGAKAPVKAAQPSKKEAAKESRGSKCEASSTQHHTPFDCFYSLSCLGPLHCSSACI